MDTVLQVRKAPGQFACLVNLMWLLCFCTGCGKHSFKFLITSLEKKLSYSCCWQKKFAVLLLYKHHLIWHIKLK